MSNDILVKVGADISDFSRKMSQSSQSLKNFGQANKATFDAFKTTGKIVTGAGLALAAGLGVAVKTAADFESSMSRVGALSGATDVEMAQLTQTAKDLGATTVFSASEAAEGMSYLAMAGFETNEIVSAMPGLLNLAAAGQLDLGTAADITSNILSGFGIEASKTGEVADVLTKTFTSSNTTMESLGESFKMLAPTANALGIPLEDAAAAVGLLGDAGIQGSMAGSQLSMALTRLSSPSSQAAGIMKDLGFNAFNSSGEMKSLEDIVRELTDSTSDLTEEQRMHAISTIFGAQSMKSILTLMDAGADTLGDFTNELRNSGGAAQEIADKQLDNLHGQITLLKSALEGAAISIGSALLPALKVLVSAIQWLVDKFNSLGEGSKSFIAIGTALTAVFALIVGPILLLIGFIPNIIAGFTALATVFRTVVTVLKVARVALVGFSGPIGWIITAVILLATVIFKYWTPIKGFFVSLWKSVSNAFVSGYNAIDNATHGWLSNGMAVYKSFYNTGIELFKRYWEYVKDTFSNALDFLKALIRLDFAGMSDAIMTQTNLVKSFLGDSWKIIVDNMKQPLSNLYSSIRNTFTDIYNWLNVKTDGFFGAYIALWVGFFTAVVDVVKAGWALIRDTFSNTIEFLIGLATLDFGRMNDAIKDQTEVLKTFLTEIWTTIRDNIGEKLMDIVTLSIEKLTELKDNIVDKFVEIGESIAEWLMSMPEVIAEKLTLWGLAFAEWFVEQKDNIVEYLLGWAESIGEWFDTMPEVIYEKLIEWGRTIEEWFNEMPETIVSTLEGWRDAMVEWTERQDEENREQFGKWGETISEWFESIPGTIREKLEVWKTTISDKFSEMKETVSTKLSEWKETIIGWFDKQPGNIRSSLTQWWSTFSTWMSEIPGKITAKLEEWWEAFKTWFKELPNKPEVKNAGSDMIDKVGEGNEAQRADFTSKLGRLIIDVAKAALAMAAVALFAVGRELIRDLISGVQSMSSSLNAKFSELGRGIVTKISGFFSDMVTAGKSLIAGLINGIKQMSAQAIEAVTGVVNSVVKKAKSALKIKSPSRVFTEIGEFTGMGLVRGMDATNSAVERASERMTNAAIIDDPNIDMSYATPSGMRGTLSSAINGTVDVNSNGRDSALVGAIQELRRDMTNLRVDMDGQTVGRITKPHIDREDAYDSSVRRYFD